MDHAFKLGFWAALLSGLLGVCYCAAQLLSWMNVLVHPHELFWLFFPSLFLAPAFVITLVCLHYAASASMRIWTALGVAFSLIYCTFATLNYFVQLTIIVPGMLNGTVGESHLLIFKQGSFLFAMDCLGYFFMSFSSLFSALAFRRTEKALYAWMLANGLLVIVFIAAYFQPFFYYVGAPWLVTFSMSMVYAGILFRKRQMQFLGKPVKVHLDA